jgi:Tfp pilus assembly protein FimT
VVSVMAILAAATVPQLLAGLGRVRAVAAARHLAHLCGLARFEAVGRGRAVALLFRDIGSDYQSQLFVDGNRNGVRLADVASGIDAPLSIAESLSAQFSGVRIALDPDLGLGSDPIRLSGSSLLTFSPLGTATAGSVYVLGSDGTQMAVRVMGVTGRTRVQRYERSTQTWEMR